MKLGFKKEKSYSKIYVLIKHKSSQRPAANCSNFLWPFIGTIHLTHSIQAVELPIL